MLFGKTFWVKQMSKEISCIFGAHWNRCLGNKKLLQTVNNFGVKATAFFLRPFVDFIMQCQRKSNLKTFPFFGILKFLVFFDFFAFCHISTLIKTILNQLGLKSNIFNNFSKKLLTAYTVHVRLLWTI